MLKLGCVSQGPVCPPTTETYLGLYNNALVGVLPPQTPFRELAVSPQLWPQFQAALYQVEADMTMDRG